MLQSNTVTVITDWYIPPFTALNIETGITCSSVLVRSNVLIADSNKYILFINIIIFPSLIGFFVSKAVTLSCNKNAVFLILLI